MGRDRSTAKGNVQLSYRDARIRKTKTMERAKITHAGTPSWALFSWKLMPR
jgi:hypothetical protein